MNTYDDWKLAAPEAAPEAPHAEVLVKVLRSDLDRRGRGFLRPTLLNHERRRRAGDRHQRYLLHPASVGIPRLQSRLLELALEELDRERLALLFDLRG